MLLRFSLRDPCVPCRLRPVTLDNAWLWLSHCDCPQSHTDLAEAMLNRKKGPRKPSKSVSSSFAGSSEAAEEEHKINLLDSGAVKRELDEGAIRVKSKPSVKAQQADVNCHTVYIRQSCLPCCLQAAKGAGLQEDHYVSNVKILLGLIT